MVKQQVCQVFSDSHCQSLFQVPAWTHTRWLGPKQRESGLFRRVRARRYLSTLLIFCPASLSSVLLMNACASRQHWDTRSVRYPQPLDCRSTWAHASSVHVFRPSASSWLRHKVFSLTRSVPPSHRPEYLHASAEVVGDGSNRVWEGRGHRIAVTTSLPVWPNHKQLERQQKHHELVGTRQRKRDFSVLQHSVICSHICNAKRKRGEAAVHQRPVSKQCTFSDSTALFRPSRDFRTSPWTSSVPHLFIRLTLSCSCRKACLSRWNEQQQQQQQQHFYRHLTKLQRSPASLSIKKRKTWNVNAV